MVTKPEKINQKDPIQDSEEQEDPKPMERGFQEEADQYYHGTEFRRMVVRRK